MIPYNVFIQWAKHIGAESETVTDLIDEDNEKIGIEIMEQIQKVNRRAISSAQKVSDEITIN